MTGADLPAHLSDQARFPTAGFACEQGNVVFSFSRNRREKLNTALSYGLAFERLEQQVAVGG